MEHVPGGTLRDLIVNMAQLPEAVASIYTHQLLLGLAFLHSCGAAHHTLCATNVSAATFLLFTCHASAELLRWASASHHNEVLMHSTRDAYSFDCMCKGGSLNDNACVLVSHESGRESVVLKLANFGNGNSKLLSSSSSSCSSGHIAPEMQQQELRGVDSRRRADMWCLGCTVLEMLNGTTDDSSSGTTAGTTATTAANDSSLLQFSTACSDFVQLCMQTEPTDRPSALQLLQHSFVAAPSTCSSTYGSYSSGSYTGDSPHRLARHSFDSPNSQPDAALLISSDSSKLQQHYSNNNCSNSNSNSKSNSSSSSSGRAPASDWQVPSPVIHYGVAVPARRHCWTDASSAADATTTAAGVADISSSVQWLNATAAAAANTRSSPGSAFASGSSDDCAVEHSVPVGTSAAPLSRATAEQQYASTRLLRPRALSLPRLLSTSNTLHTSEALLLGSSAHATASGLAAQASNSSSSTSAAASRTQSLPSLLFKRRVHTVSTSPVSVASGLVSPNDDDADCSTAAAAAVALDCNEKLYESVGRVRARRHSAPTASITSSGTSPQWWLHQSDAAVEAACSTHTALQQQQQQQQQQQHLSNSHPNSAAIAAAAANAGAQHDAHQQQRRRTSWTAGTVYSGSTSNSIRISSSALLSSSMTSRSAQASPDARHNGWSVTVKRGGLPPPVPLNTSNTLANTSLLLSASASGSVKRL
eukprot:13920-Heterococcus_DN1.PRE.1